MPVSERLCSRDDYSHSQGAGAAVHGAAEIILRPLLTSLFSEEFAKSWSRDGLAVPVVRRPSRSLGANEARSP